MNCQVGCPIRKSMTIKLILSSSWLIAEYHVLHRLLLPRHSPNALFALDLIQKEQDLRLMITEAGKKLSSHFHKSKAYFPALYHALPPERLHEDDCSPHHPVSYQVDNVGHQLRRQIKNNWLVYLTWTTLLISEGIRRNGLRKQPKTRLHNLERFRTN